MTDREYDDTLCEMETLWGAAPDTAEAARFAELEALTQAYERARWTMPNPPADFPEIPTAHQDPIEALEILMAQHGLIRADLGALIGRNRATEILNRQRRLTLPMIRKIAAAWHMPEAALVQDYALALSSEMETLHDSERAKNRESRA